MVLKDVRDVVISVDIGCVMMVVVNSLNIKIIHVGDRCGVLGIRFNALVAAVVSVNVRDIVHGHV